MPAEHELDSDCDSLTAHSMFYKCTYTDEKITQILSESVTSLKQCLKQSSLHKGN